MVNLYDYINYRKYLRALYKSLKKKGDGFSYQKYSKILGLKTKCSIFSIISGHRNLTKAVLVRIVNSLKLESNEARYFEALVSMNHAKNKEQSDYFYHKLMKIRNIGEPIISVSSLTDDSAWKRLARKHGSKFTVRNKIASPALKFNKKDYRFICNEINTAYNIIKTFLQINKRAKNHYLLSFNFPQIQQAGNREDK